MKTINLMFATPALESAFSRFIRRDVEMGGYLFATWHPRIFEGCHWKVKQREIGPLDPLLFISDWWFLPNQHDKPEAHYRTMDWQYNREAAELNAKSKRNLQGDREELPFHTHPVGATNHLSAADLSKAMSCDWLYRPRSAEARTVVASSYPLRVICYDVHYSKAKYPAPVVECGEFFSWREKQFNDWREYIQEAR